MKFDVNFKDLRSSVKFYINLTVKLLHPSEIYLHWGQSFTVEILFEFFVFFFSSVDNFVGKGMLTET